LNLDPLFLSRLQFGMTIGFHFLFPPLTIGLSWLLVIVEWMGWRKGDEDYIRAGKFFGKMLGLIFAMGVASGIVMEFQFGTNWSAYSKFVGDIFGAPLAVEAVFAFFLESTFLGLYLFGRNRVSKGVHWFSILLVAVGSAISAFWIIVANSWQQTPAGYVLQNSRAELMSFKDAVFNASTIIRFSHTFIASLIAGSFLMAGVSGYHVNRRGGGAAMRKTLKLSLTLGFIVSIMAWMPTGHEHGSQVARTQPEKFAAMEGVIEGRTRAPMLLFGIPTEEPPGVANRIEIPGLLSWLAFDDSEAYVSGLQDQRAAGRETPPFVVTLLSFHLMVGLGLLFMVLTALGVLLLFRKKLYESPRYLKTMLWAIPLPLIACQLGWMVAEIGRQPWVVYGLLKTRNAFSANVNGASVLFSIIMFGLVYLAIGAVFLYTLVAKIKRGPEPLPE
jgi:cytochrome d ubiquinol oxidase subunit I